MLERISQPPAKNLTNNDAYVTTLLVDNFENTIKVVFERGIKVNVIKLTIEHAKEIGFINFNVLDKIVELQYR